MQPKQQYETPDLFRTGLDQILNRNHPLYVLANQIDWSVVNKRFGPLYVEDKGRPGKPTRLMVGLHYLKHTYNESDESVLDRFLENAYWQYFCGFEFFQHSLPVESSSMTRFRNRIGPSGGEELLKELIATAKRNRMIKKTDKNKIYSVHAPEVEYISKGKAHKRYEFGNKLGVATTSRDNWAVGVQSFQLIDFAKRCRFNRLALGYF